MQALSVGHAIDPKCAALGRVHSVFARALNLEIHADLWTVVSCDRSDLPFGIRVPSSDFNTAGLKRDDAVHVRAGWVGIHSRSRAVVIDCRGASRWMPTWEVKHEPGLDSRLRAVSVAALHRAWHGSASLSDAVVCALNDRQTLGKVLARVIGHGPGCTPAGDDVLAGVLAVLKSPDVGPDGAEAAQALCDAMLPLLATTTDISAHLLRQAAGGLFGRAVHDLVCALIGDSVPQDLRAAIQRVIEAGATSGADLCLGMLASARAFLAIDHERAAA